MNKWKKESGITLVALVVAIVVLLILAGITTMYMLGDKNIFNQASDAKLQTELSKIEERANLIYVDKLIQNKSNGINKKPTMQEVVEQLKREGYQIEQVETEGNKVIGISLEKNSITLEVGVSDTIKVILEESSAPSYYALVNGKYYELYDNYGKITIARKPSNISTEGEETSPLLTVVSEDETIAITTIDNSTKTITIVAKKEGTTTITVSLADENSQSTNCTVTVVPPKVADIVDKIQETNITVKDENGNKITIPGGFKVVPNSPEGTDESQKVEYIYNGDKTPCVQDGIVIEDEKGNQFVWIPIGIIKNKDNTTTTITLGRYTFDKTDGTPKLEQNADDYTEIISLAPDGDSPFQELEDGIGNISAKNLAEFITKTKESGGYYLGRYEASSDEEGRASSKADKQMWNYIAQVTAATLATQMYDENSNIESDLINSYSWDTAIIFIQEYSGEKNYANKTPISSRILNTGESGDKVCNIYDLASNCQEWSTEHCTMFRSPCVPRGGSYHKMTTSFPSTRGITSTGVTADAYSFRTIGYIK